MSETTITAMRATTDPQYAKTAAGLLEAARAFFREPENERMYQEEKKGGRKRADDLGGSDLIHRG